MQRPYARWPWRNRAFSAQLSVVALDGMRVIVSYQAVGAEAKRLRPSASERYLVMRCPRTLLPASSSGGENVPRPPLPGDTVTMPPATPLLPGRPTSYSHSPHCSYSPAVASTASTRLQSRVSV